LGFWFWLLLLKVALVSVLELTRFLPHFFLLGLNSSVCARPVGRVGSAVCLALSLLRPAGPSRPL
jgi:hypothetical protein